MLKMSSSKNSFSQVEGGGDYILTRSKTSRARKNLFTKKTTDVYGKELVYHEIKHHDSCSEACCEEYVVTSAVFNFRRWSFLTATFFSLAFYSEFHNTDITILGVLLFLLCCALLMKLHRRVKRESLLVVASIGLQLTTTFVTGRKATQFIFQKDILDVVINEGILMHRVLHYLAVLLKNDTSTEDVGIAEVIPLFQHTMPRLDCLERMYRGLQSTFYPRES